MPMREDADKYVFCFLLSRSVRHQVYNNLLASLIKMKGIKEDSLVDQINNLLAGENNAQTRSLFEASYVVGLSINHYLEAMVIEMAHAFSEPKFNVETLFSSVNEAVVSLLSVAVYALSFPATFWSNIGIFSEIIYNAFRFLLPDEARVLLLLGYTRSYDCVTRLSREDVNSGEIPKLFLNRQGRSYPNIAKFAPVGERYDVPVRSFPWMGNLANDSDMYIPFRRREYDAFNDLKETPFSNSMIDVISVLKDAVTTYNRKTARSKTTSQALVNFLTSLRKPILKYGHMAHFEINILYKTIFRGVDIPYYRYRGEDRPMQYRRVGLRSSIGPALSGLPAVD